MQYSRPNFNPNLGQNLGANIGENCENLAKAYIPLQSYNNLYSIEEALNRGTLFECLYRPYMPYKKGHSNNPCCPGRQVNPYLPAR